MLSVITQKSAKQSYKMVLRLVQLLFSFLQTKLSLSRNVADIKSIFRSANPFS